MLYGIEARSLPDRFPFSDPINLACWQANFFPLFAGAIATREILIVNRSSSAASYISGDGGHGLFQLTSEWPPDWDDPQANCAYAIANWLYPDLKWWNQNTGYLGENLMRCTAASFNAGRSAAWNAHMNGNVDAATTGGNYGAAVVSYYDILLNDSLPW
jgi:hypothetical protein